VIFQKLTNDIKYPKKHSNNNSNSSSKLEDDFSFFEQEHLLHQVTPTELRKHIEIVSEVYNIYYFLRTKQF